MIRLLTALMAMGLVLGAGTWITAQSDGDAAKRPLDLPNGKVGQDDEDEEDEPETIVFYGQEYEADAFFWCMDRSCSMGWGSPVPIQVLKNEVTQSIESLSRNAEFGLVNFGSSTTTWRESPQKANPANKAAAKAWVQSMSADGSTCLGDAGVKTVQISNLCRKRNKSIIILSDGEPNCPGCGEESNSITTANWQRTPINTLFVGGGASGVACMQGLANANGGSFTQIN